MLPILYRITSFREVGASDENFNLGWLLWTFKSTYGTAMASAKCGWEIMESLKIPENHANA